MNLKWLFDSQYFETLTNRDELTIEYVKICMCKQGKDIVVRMSKDIASNDDTSDWPLPMFMSIAVPNNLYLEQQVQMNSKHFSRPFMLITTWKACEQITEWSQIS